MTRIAVLADFLEEKWPSMDLAAEELAAHLKKLEGVDSLLFRPRLRTARPGAPASGIARALGRFVQLPGEVAISRPRADFYHVADHSYAHLAMLFPSERVGVYCHDIDAFRALLPGAKASGPRRLLSQFLLRGLRHARVVFHSTRAVREEILEHRLVPAERLVQAPYGVAAEFLQSPDFEHGTQRYLLHVGSCIPRKNIGFLLEVFAALRRTDPTLRLIQVGGQWTDAERGYLHVQRLDSCVEQRRGISRAELARLYSGAAVVLVPSLAEGFGLPIIEALACGAPVVASDLAVLREVGLEGTRFCSTSSVPDWTGEIARILATNERVTHETRTRIRARYTWLAHAKAVRDAYSAMESTCPPKPGSASSAPAVDDDCS